MMRKIVLTGCMLFGLVAGVSATAAVYEVYGSLLAEPCACTMCGKLWIEFSGVGDAINAANKLGGVPVQVGPGDFKLDGALPLPKSGTLLVAREG